MTAPAAPVLAEGACVGSDWISVPAAAKQLGIGERTLYRLAAERQVPHRRIGARKLFAPEDIAEIKANAAVRPLPGRAAA